MSLARSIACVLLTAMLVVGCEREETAVPPPAGADAGAGAAGGASESAAADVPAVPAPTSPDAVPAGGAAAADPTAPATQPSGAATATPEQAQTLIDQTLQYIKENKMDLAEKSLTQLEQLKPKLPAEYHSKIDAARKAFTAAKTGQGLKLDGLLPSGGGGAGGAGGTAQ